MVEHWCYDAVNRVSVHGFECSLVLQITLHKQIPDIMKWNEIWQSFSVERSKWPRVRWCGTGGFQEQGKCLFIGLAARSLLFSLSLLWFCGFVLWSWGLRTDRVLIALSKPCIANFFNNNNNNKSYQSMRIIIETQLLQCVSEGLLFTSKHIKGKLSKIKQLCGKGSVWF